MKAKKYWDISCVSWKEFYCQCKKFLDDMAMDCCTQDDFDKYHPCKINSYDSMESQEEHDELIINMVSPQEAEKIEAKCDEVYGEAYNDTMEECKEAWGWE